MWPGICPPVNSPGDIDSTQNQLTLFLPDKSWHGPLPQLQLIVEPCLSGIRIDSFLARHLRNYTTWRLHRMVCEGCVQIDGHLACAAQRVHCGQHVEVRLLEPPDKLLPAESQRVDVVYEDPWLMVIDKPAGIVAHPVGGFQAGTLSNLLQHHFDLQTKVRGLLRPGIVHRLDRMTSGLLVVAKDHATHRQLSLDFQAGRPSKSYTALVEGDPEFYEKRIELPIGRHPGGKSVLMSAAVDALRPRPARTDVRVVRRAGKVAVMECDLHTGRNHQIRVHLAAVGHPILGDEFYRAFGEISPQWDVAEDQRLDQRHALHASKLVFRHPVLGTEMRFQSSPPADFRDMLAAHQ